jgi:hypothetical protein
MAVDDERPPDPSLQPSTHQSFQFGNKSQNSKNTAATAACMYSSNDNDSDALLTHSSEMGQTYGTCGHKQHCKILHLGSRIYPRIGCFKEILQFQM